MVGEGREGQAVITAKPLRRKELGHPTPSTEPDLIGTNRQRHNNELTTNRQQQEKSAGEESTKLKCLDAKNTFKIILYIVRDTPGIDHTGIYKLVKMFCKKQNYFEWTNQAGYQNFLNKLIKQGKIDYAIVDGRRRYFVHIEGIEQWQKAM